MGASSTRISLGFAQLLVDPDAEKHGPYCRDELLFSALAEDAPEMGEEVRDVLPGHLPMACRGDREPGLIVVIARKRIGGALEGAAADYLLRRWTTTPPTAVLDVELRDLGLLGPSLVVPRDGEPRQILTPSNPTFPLAGVNVVSARRLAAKVRAIEPAEQVTAALSILNLCATYRFLASVVAC